MENKEQLLIEKQKLETELLRHDAAINELRCSFRSEKFNNRYYSANLLENEIERFSVEARLLEYNIDSLDSQMKEKGVSTDVFENLKREKQVKSIVLRKSKRPYADGYILDTVIYLRDKLNVFDIAKLRKKYIDIGLMTFVENGDIYITYDRDGIIFDQGNMFDEMENNKITMGELD
jgi:hypothetical protein